MRVVAGCVLSLLLLTGIGGYGATRSGVERAPVTPRPTRHVLSNDLAQPTVIVLHPRQEVAR